LKYVLNDDMAINCTAQYKKEPLIDNRDEKEEKLAINQMIRLTENPMASVPELDARSF
jgi:hypothetical protein